jgi:hypothetical protein
VNLACDFQSCVKRKGDRQYRTRKAPRPAATAMLRRMVTEATILPVAAERGAREPLVVSPISSVQR